MSQLLDRGIVRGGAAVVDRVPREEIPAILGELEQLRAALWARLQAPPPAPEVTGRPTGTALDVEDARLYLSDEHGLDLTRARLYELARQNVIPSLRVGRAVRFNTAALDEWIAQGGKALAGGWRRRSDD